jgi:hypothetical protein
MGSTSRSASSLADIVLIDAKQPLRAAKTAPISWS